MPVVDTEHEIQDDSEEGEYGDDQQPRELPPRVSGIDQDDDTDGDYEEDVKDREYGLEHRQLSLSSEDE
jgi:hypothetical protein